MTDPLGMPEPTSGYVNVNGLRLHYLDWGGDGPPILILHATGFLGRIYAPIARPLTAIGHVFSYDQRGHGDSERPSTPAYRWDLTMSDLEGFITAMGLKSVRGFGHSSGATAIGSLAGVRPDLISRAVLAEPIIHSSPDGPANPNEMRERTLRRKRSFESVEVMYRNFENKPPYDTWRKDMLRDYCEYGTREQDGARVLKCLPEVEAQFYGTAREFDGLGRIVRSQAPMLILFGENSAAEGVLLKDRLIDGSSKRRVVVMPGTGHFLPMEKPDEVARMALDFLGAE